MNKEKPPVLDRIEAILRAEETADLLPPWSCLPVGDPKWIELKAKRIEPLIQQAEMKGWRKGNELKQKRLDIKLKMAKAEVAREIMSQIQEFRHKPHLYHYRCWASGTVLVRDEWGEEPMYQCHSYNGDFNCGCRNCSWGIGLIRGELELQDFERHQNDIIDDIIRAFKSKYMEGK